MHGSSSSRPRVLFVTAHLPYPPVSGGRLRELELLARLSQDFDIHVCAVSKTYEEDVVQRHALLDFCAVSVFPSERVGQGKRECEQIAGHRSRALTKTVRGAVRERRCDLVHVESFYVLQHVPSLCDVPILLVEQNIEFHLARQRSETAVGLDEKRRHFREYRRTRSAEIAAWKRADLCAAVTHEDATELKRVVPRVRVIPDGCDHLRRGEGAPLVAPEGVPLLVYVGNFAYAPNVDAARHLCRDIFPSIREQLPEARLLLVGNAPPPDVSALAGEGIEVTGRVATVQPYLRAADVVLCPLRIGGGVKVKVLEAVALGKAVVTTSIGVQGLGPSAREAVRVADDPATFAAEVVRVASDVKERTRLEAGALRLAATLPTWDDAAAALADAYAEVLTLRGVNADATVAVR